MILFFITVKKIELTLTYFQENVLFFMKKNHLLIAIVIVFFCIFSPF